MPLLQFLIFMLCFSACEKNKEHPRPSAVEVTTFKVQEETIPAVFEYVGVVQSSHPVEIRARVEGYLDKIAYQEGDIVKKGQLLFQIDSRPFIAALDNAKGQLARNEAELWEAQRAVERFRPLYEKKAASKRDLDNATAQLLASEANVASAKAQIREAELNLSYTVIRSPINGASNKSNYREGALITPGANGLLTTLYVIDPIWAYFNVSEGDLLKYREEVLKEQLKYPSDMNFDVQLILSDGSTFESKGKVNFADPSLQQTTGTMLVRAEFINPDNQLKPGQFVRAKVLGAIRPHAIVIPQKAVLQGQDGMYVYVVNPEGKAERRAIVPGDWYKTYWIIKAGLKADEQVIVDGINKVQNGVALTIKKAEVFHEDSEKK
ncbi:Efflux pump periplasmic linker BepF [Chlamydiales bacterium STE3]|nr:Efflux pump periplasmic linker BepF [Chlamydiales bacterium STE3]